MIVNIKLKLKKGEMRKDYRPVIVSLIKAVLSNRYPDHYKKLYQSGAMLKGFTFSVALNRPRFDGDRVLLEDDSIKLSISSGDEMEALTLYNAFQKSRSYVHPLEGGNEMKIESVSVLPTPFISSNSVIVKFQSPLVVRKHVKGEPDRYFLYSEDGFDAALNEIVSRLTDKGGVKLEGIAPKSTVVPSFGVNVRCSIGTYRMTGEPEVLNALLKGGIGSRRSEGFGHFIVIGR